MSLNGIGWRGRTFIDDVGMDAQNTGEMTPYTAFCSKVKFSSIE
tara:strand:+ start:1063 stop:1194 length:132 start_codon:yes stop_codon:yes gene_type:complete